MGNTLEAAAEESWAKLHEYKGWEQISHIVHGMTMLDNTYLNKPNHHYGAFVYAIGDHFHRAMRLNGVDASTNNTLEIWAIASPMLQARGLMKSDLALSVYYANPEWKDPKSWKHRLAFYRWARQYGASRKQALEIRSWIFVLWPMILVGQILFWVWMIIRGLI